MAAREALDAAPIGEACGYKGKVLFTEHHEAHAASAFFPSPFDSAAILTIDGVGEWATSSFGVGRGNEIDLLAEMHFPHSLGLLYSAFTYYTGFKVNSRRVQSDGSGALRPAEVRASRFWMSWWICAKTVPCV